MVGVSFVAAVILPQGGTHRRTRLPGWTPAPARGSPRSRPGPACPDQRPTAALQTSAGLTTCYKTAGAAVTAQHLHPGPCGRKERHGAKGCSLLCHGMTLTQDAQSSAAASARGQSPLHFKNRLVAVAVLSAMYRASSIPASCTTTAVCGEAPPSKEVRADSAPPWSPARSRPVRLRGRGSAARGVKGFGVRDPPDDPPAAGPSCGSCGRHRTSTCAVKQEPSVSQQHRQLA